MKLPTILLFALFSMSVLLQAQDKRLMTTAEYKSFLDNTEIELPKWETAFQKVDPAKTNVSYAVGKQIEQWRDLGLKEIGWVRQSLAKERAKHTVSGELALRGFLESVFSIADTVVQTEVAAGISLSDLEKYAPEISSLVIKVANDVTARVELLEKGKCP